MRQVLALFGIALALPAFADRILLVPVDDRPAVSQFACMIGDIAGAEVVTPPRSILGKFKQPASPELLLQWLASQKLDEFSAVVLSADMVAYGGLIASRTDRSSQKAASERLRQLWRIRKTAHKTPFYVFSALTRIAPTAVAENRAWRNDLYYWAVSRERAKLYNDPEAKRKADAHAKAVPPAELAKYDLVRERNVAIQQEIVKMAYHGAFTHVVFGQDDAAPVGPHIREISQIRQTIDRLKVTGRTQFCMGIDQIANCLVSKVLIDRANWSPQVALICADNEGLDKIAAYESEPVRESLADQLETSGAKVVADKSKADYLLYLNTPDPDQADLQGFLNGLGKDLEAGQPVALADVNLGWTGTADTRLFDAITQSKRAPQLLSYAGWNTAGNTMGTTIPAANAYLLALKTGSDPYRREVAARTFVLHRLVNDYFYNRYVRPEAYKMIEKMQAGAREEIAEPNVDAVEAYVRKDMTERLNVLFRDQMVAHPFKIGSDEYHVIGLSDVKVSLPWPRAYEVSLEFKLDVRKAD